VTALELRRVAGQKLGALDLVLSPGVTTVVAGSDEGGGELVAIAAGLSRPRKGWVRLAGGDPFRHPEQRRRSALLLDPEIPLEGRTLEQSISQALVLRGSRESAREVLASAGIGAWAERQPGSLSPTETRSVALALALSSDGPVLAALAEPFSAGLDRATIVSKLAGWSRAGTIVLCVTASRRDAADLGGRVLELARVRKRSTITEVTGDYREGPLELVVRASPAQALAAALTPEDAVFTVVYDETRAPEEIIVRGPDVERSSLAVLRAARESGARIERLESRPVGSAAPRPAGPPGGATP